MVQSGHSLNHQRGSSRGTFPGFFTYVVSVSVAPTDAVVPIDFFPMNNSQKPVEQQEIQITHEVMDKIVVGSTGIVFTSRSLGYVDIIFRGGSLLPATKVTR